MSASLQVWIRELRRLWDLSLASYLSPDEFRLVAGLGLLVLVVAHRVTLKGLQAPQRTWPRCFFAVGAGVGLVLLALGAARLHLSPLLSQMPWAEAGVAAMAGLVLIAPLWGWIHRVNYLQSLLALFLAAAVAAILATLTGALTRATRESLREWHRTEFHTRSVNEILR